MHGELDISWVGGQKYQGYEVLNTMDRGFDLPWVGGVKNTMGRVFDIPYIGGLICH